MVMLRPPPPPGTKLAFKFMGGMVLVAFALGVVWLNARATSVPGAPAGSATAHLIDVADGQTLMTTMGRVRLAGIEPVSACGARPATVLAGLAAGAPELTVAAAPGGGHLVWAGRKPVGLGMIAAGVARPTPSAPPQWRQAFLDAKRAKIGAWRCA